MDYWTQSTSNILVAAHRGWMAKYPENTLEAFLAAIELGVDRVETEVRVWAGAYASNEANIDLAIQMGAEFITCNNPDEVLAILRKKNLHN